MKQKASALLVTLTLLTGVSAASAEPPGGAQLYTGVFVSGSPTTKYDIVFLGDGFTASEQDQFNWKVTQAVNALWNLEPYASHMCAFNIWRVNVVSNESGVDKPGKYPAIYRDTALDCTYGNPLDPVNPTPYRLITSKSPWKCYEAAGKAPAYDAVFVLVNDPEWGGASGGLTYSSIHPDFHQIITHELGHKIGGLADEYHYYYDKTDPPSTYTGWEPTEPNVTTKTLLAEIKWNDLILPGTPLPTTLGNATENDLGLWEGAKYHDYGIYRPQYTCQMRDSEDPFCAVCRRHLAGVFEYHETEPPTLECSGMLRKLLKLSHMYWEEYDWRFLLPQCLTCPPNVTDMDQVIYVMKGLPAGFQMRIVDEMGQVVAEGRSTKGGLIASFNADPMRQYFVDVSGSGAPTGEVLNFQSDLFINGEEMALP
ncbi:MAG: M64 family metallopeptidase [Phycisphaerae bacterium]